MKVKLRTIYLYEVALSALILVAAMIVMFVPVEMDFRHVAISFLAATCFFRAGVEFVFRTYSEIRGKENMDERDQEILNKSANRSIEWTQHTLVILLLIFVLLAAINPKSLMKGFLFCIFGIYLPDFYKSWLFLYYQKHT